MSLRTYSQGDDTNTILRKLLENQTQLIGGTLALTISNSLSGSVQSLVGPGAVNVTQLMTELEATGVADALTLANGTPGQIKSIVLGVDGGSSVLTPTNSTFSTATFANAGDSLLLQYSASVGWFVLGVEGTVLVY